MDTFKDVIVIGSAVIGLIAGLVTLYAHFSRGKPPVTYPDYGASETFSPESQYSPSPSKKRITGVFAAIFTLVCFGVVAGAIWWLARKTPPSVPAKTAQSNAPSMTRKSPKNDASDFPKDFGHGNEPTVGDRQKAAGSGPDNAVDTNQKEPHFRPSIPATTYPRNSRAHRWTVQFETKSTSDYLSQLDACGVALGVADSQGKLMLIRNLLERPAQPRYENANNLNGIWLVVDSPGFARNIADLLQLDFIPKEILAFYPRELEDKMAAMELTYGKKYGRKTEDDIAETTLRISVRLGKPEILVVSQKGK